jgi:hypothetical protein
VKPGFKNATNVAFFRLNTPEALRGCRLPRSRGVELQNANSFLRHCPSLGEQSRALREKSRVSNKRESFNRKIEALAILRLKDSDAVLYQQNTKLGTRRFC